jgi:hypothetical protein
LVPIGTSLPQHESQVRPLVGLPLEQAAQAWQNAEQLAGTGPVTAQHVKAAAAQFRPNPAPKPKRQPKPVANLPRILGLLERIHELFNRATYGTRHGEYAPNILKHLDEATLHLHRLRALLV